MLHWGMPRSTRFAAVRALEAKGWDQKNKNGNTSLQWARVAQIRVVIGGQRVIFRLSNVTCKSYFDRSTDVASRKYPERMNLV
uniref:Type II toxin-antitoxin system HicA family toxin n=1 Tax=Steinernema glaseri TaxID=37863 RepID=A0A1I7Y776_9BILA